MKEENSIHEYRVERWVKIEEDEKNARYRAFLGESEEKYKIMIASNTLSFLLYILSLTSGKP